MTTLIQQLKMACLVLLSTMVLTGCKKDTVVTPVVDDSIYTATCDIGELIWLADNNSVLLNDHCNGNIQIVNTSTKAVRTWNFAPNLLVQRFYYTQSIPDKIFFTSLTRQASGGFSTPQRLYSLGLANFDTVFIKGNITDNPFAQGFVGGGNKLVLKTGAGTELINLATQTSQVLTVSGDAQSFSPDFTKVLFYQNYVNPITNATTYDQNCSCTQPLALTGYGKSLWRTQGIMSYYTTSFPAKLEFQNLQTGAILKTFNNDAAGPWISPSSNHAIVFVKGPNWSTDGDGILVDYDFINNTTRELVHSPYFLGSFFKGIFLAAVSPDERKLAYVVSGLKLKIISF